LAVPRGHLAGLEPRGRLFRWEAWIYLEKAGENLLRQILPALPVSEARIQCDLLFGQRNVGVYFPLGQPLVEGELRRVDGAGCLSRVDTINPTTDTIPDTQRRRRPAL
jgi:hypothetical protein